MPFKWKFLITFSNKLLKEIDKHKDNETQYRVVINRYYFGSFCIARDFSEKYLHNTYNHDGKDHERVKNDYKGNYKKNIEKQTAKDVAWNLNRLHWLRKRADYNLIPPISSDDARNAQDYSQQILQLLRKLASKAIHPDVKVDYGEFDLSIS